MVVVASKPKIMRRTFPHRSPSNSVLLAAFYEAHPDGREDHPDYPEQKVCVGVHGWPYPTNPSAVLEIGQLSQFSLAQLHVPDINNDLVFAYLRQHIQAFEGVACETLKVGTFSPNEHQFRAQIAIVQRLVETLQHVEKLK